jgi:hypothetical protein
MLVNGFWRLARDLMLTASGVPPAVLTVPERAEEIAREAASWTVDDLVAVLGLCRDAREGLMTRNVTPGLTMTVLLSRLALRAA